jgi:hypothetical protein
LHQGRSDGPRCPCEIAAGQIQGNLHALRQFVDTRRRFYVALHNAMVLHPLCNGVFIGLNATFRPIRGRSVMRPTGSISRIHNFETPSACQHGKDQIPSIIAKFWPMQIAARSEGQICETVSLSLPAAIARDETVPDRATACDGGAGAMAT